MYIDAREQARVDEYLEWQHQGTKNAKKNTMKNASNNFLLNNMYFIYHLK